LLGGGGVGARSKPASCGRSMNNLWNCTMEKKIIS